MALHNCQGAAFLSHPQYNSWSETGKRREGSPTFYKQCNKSKSQGSSQRRGGSLACVCFKASNITRGRSHWKGCWKHCQLMSPTGTLLACWGWLEHHVSLLYQQVPHLWLAGSRWCTAGSGYTSKNSLLHHRKCQLTILGQYLGCLMPAGAKYNQWSASILLCLKNEK